MLQNCNQHPQGDWLEAISIAKGTTTDDLRDLNNIPGTCSQLPGSNSILKDCLSVYSRKKLREKPVVLSTVPPTPNTKENGECLSVISSDAFALKDQPKIIESEVGRKTGAVTAYHKRSLACDRNTFCSLATKLNKKCSVTWECVNEELKSSMQKREDAKILNDRCSSSKSNAVLAVASMKTRVYETGGCFSSGAVKAAVIKEDITEKDFCISILRSQGLLERGWPSRSRLLPEDDETNSRSNSCSMPCKVCGQLETTLNMLICDDCEEAFHPHCYHPRIKEIPIDDEWFCHSCSKKKRKSFKETMTKRSTKFTSGTGKCRGSSSKTETKAIKLMLSDTEQYTTHVRIGEAFQAEVPIWSGPINSDVIVEQVIDPSECMHEKIDRQSSKLSLIGNWLQCKQEVNGKICGKWRRAPLFEEQADNWECFCSVLWDPPHSDCSVPQELETDEILRQLKYIQMLRNRLAPKRRKLDISGNGGPSSTRKS